MEHILISSGLAFAFGAFHALEPGHGKTALLTYVASGKKSWKEGAIISISSAITHSLSIFIIAFVFHFLVYHRHVETMIADSGHVLRIVSGVLICALGFYIFYKGRKAKAHHQEHEHSCCACSLHKAHAQPTKKRYNFLTLGILGIATGMIPCPSIVVAYLSGVSVGNSLLGLQSIVFFALGMCLSLMTFIVVCSLASEKFMQRISNKKIKLNWSAIQGTVFIIIGLGTALYH